LIYYYRKNYTLAKKYFDVALNLHPFDYNALLMSAWTNYFLGKSSEAKVLFNRVLLHYRTDSSALE
jgi:tetratricopeptide (TPR) repeat protein